MFPALRSRFGEIILQTTFIKWIPRGYLYGLSYLLSGVAYFLISHISAVYQWCLISFNIAALAVNCTNVKKSSNLNLIIAYLQLYLCKNKLKELKYSSLTLSVRESSLDGRIWRLWISDSYVYRRQILTSKVNLRTERISYLQVTMATYP